MNIKQLACISAIAISIWTCTKEPAAIEQPIVETPVDTPTVVNPPPPPPPLVYLPASAFMADTGRYFAINSNATTYGLKYQLDAAQLLILNDTLRLGTMKLLPVSPTEAHILPFSTTLLKSTANGYSYLVEGRGSGTISVKDNNLIATIQKTANDNSVSSNSAVTWYNGIPGTLPLTRDDYTGHYFGFSTNASQFGNTLTFTIEPLPGTTDGVWLKEINRKAYVNETGGLVIPESAVDSALYGQSVRYLEVQTRLSGRLLQFGRQQVYGSMPPSPSDYKNYVLFRQ